MTLDMTPATRLIAAATLAAGLAGPAFAGDLTVEVRNIATVSGVLKVALFDEAGWDGTEPVATRDVDIAAATAEVTFDALSPGRYGLKIYQDVNGNGELDRGMMGIPKEPYGFSNDAPTPFGPPRFESAAIDLGEEPATATVHLK